MANYRHGATYGSLAYDLDALAREKQLDEAGAGGGHGHRADAVLCEADRHFR